MLFLLILVDLKLLFAVVHATKVRFLALVALIERVQFQGLINELSMAHALLDDFFTRPSVFILNDFDG